MVWVHMDMIDQNEVGIESTIKTMGGRDLFIFGTPTDGAPSGSISTCPL